MQNVLPIEFTERIRQQLGAEAPDFFGALRQSAPVSLRLNPFKAVDTFTDAEKISWSRWGRYLQERPVFTLDPLLHAGAYYVQEASSMFLEQVWQQHVPTATDLKVLDLCAAPGGKSTHLLSLLAGKGLLVSNEIIPNRNKILRENISKWGLANYIITQNNAADFASLPSFFDVILVDAPCSGEGLFRKDKDAIGEWSLQNVNNCAVRQHRILEEVLPCLKPGGILIYSTCTYEADENDKQIAALVDAGCSMLPVTTEGNSGIVSTDNGLQFYPHRTKGEGFYISCLKKNTGEGMITELAKTKKKQAHEMAERYLKNAHDFTLLEKGEKLFALPDSIAADFGLLVRKLNVRQSGIYMGEFKGKDFLPAHELALSVHASANLPVAEVDKETALKYLRCETISLSNAPLGWCLVSYRGLNLGWIKVMPNRVNNYYPKDWRILMR